MRRNLYMAIVGVLLMCAIAILLGPRPQRTDAGPTVENPARETETAQPHEQPTKTERPTTWRPKSPSEWSPAAKARVDEITALRNAADGDGKPLEWLLSRQTDDGHWLFRTLDQRCE